MPRESPGGPRELQGGPGRALGGSRRAPGERGPRNVQGGPREAPGATREGTTGRSRRAPGGTRRAPECTRISRRAPLRPGSRSQDLKISRSQDLRLSLATRGSGDLSPCRAISQSQDLRASRAIRGSRFSDFDVLEPEESKSFVGVLQAEGNFLISKDLVHLCAPRASSAIERCAGRPSADLAILGQTLK